MKPWVKAWSEGRPRTDAESYDLRAEAYLREADYWKANKNSKDAKVNLNWALKMAEYFKQKAKEERDNELKQVS